MAEVYAAYDSVLGCEVAVKVLSDGESATVRERFLREARIAAALGRHPHVISVHDVGEHHGRPFIAMELAPGGSIAERLEDGRPEPDRALAWLEQTAEALDAAHARGIVHRDVKPANLLIDEFENVRVADFGIARTTDRTLTHTGEVLGTAGYLAPEQARGEPCTPASDRYALALVARELLQGTARLEPVFGRALARDPERRYPTASAFVAALRRALGAVSDGRTRTNLTSLARVRRGPLVLHRTPAKLRRKVVAAALVLAAAAVAAASALTTRALTAAPGNRAAPPPPATCTASPVDHDANVVVRGAGADAFCRVLTERLSGDSVWTYRTGRALIAPDHEVSGLSLVCRLRKGRLRITVVDSGSQSIGRDVCLSQVAPDWNGNSVA
jgi:serine/threonine-protein kinase